MEFFEMKFDEEFIAVGTSNGYPSKEECKQDFENCARVLNKGSNICKNGIPIDQYDNARKVNQSNTSIKLNQLNAGALKNTKVK